MANRLIALDICPGVRPIGIGECLHRFMCKTIALITGRDMEVVCEVKHLATGLKVDIEVQSYDEFYDDGWGSFSLMQRMHLTKSGSSLECASSMA